MASKGHDAAVTRGKVWLLAVVAACLVVMPFEASKDYDFVCEYTGSIHGYRQWFTGHRTGESYQKSVLEEFVEEHHPALLEHRWTSFRGDGMNLFGIGLRGTHDRPGPVLRIARNPGMSLDKATDDEKLELFLALRQGGREAEEAIEGLLPVSRSPLY